MSRQKFYIPFILPLLELLPDSDIIDLGCGRGEFLELLDAEGARCVGIDSDPDMIETCLNINLNATNGDVLAYLNAARDNSASVISAFHVVEHLSFPQLQELVSQALRILKPGGLLMLETPNPQNLVVGSYSFFLDPTHTKPIPWELLEFVTEFSGFSENKVFFLQEPAGISDKVDVTISDVLFGVSPDYSVIAQKGGSSELNTAIGPLLNADCGVTLSQLSTKYDSRLEGKIERITNRSIRTEQQVETFQSGLDHLSTTVQDKDAKIQELTVRVAVNESRLEIKNSSNEKLSSELEKVTATLQISTALEHDLSFQLETARVELEGKSQTIQGLDAEIKLSGNKLEDSNNQIEEQADISEGLRTELNRTSTQLQNQINISDNVRTELDRISTQLQCSEDENAQLGSQIRHTEAVVTALNEASDVAKSHEERVSALETSISWRITLPGRFMASLILWLVKLPFTVVAFVFYPVIRLLMNYCLSRPKLRANIVSVTNRLPRFNRKLIQFAENAGLVEPIILQETLANMQDCGSISPEDASLGNQGHSGKEEGINLSYLSPRTRQIYFELEKHKSN
jgi:SAM-dependent methyltransferase